MPPLNSSCTKTKVKKIVATASDWRSMVCIYFSFTGTWVITAFLSLLDVCEPSWQQSRVGLIISQFASSILVIVFGVFLPLILIIARKLYRHFHKKVRNYVVYGFIDKGEYVICLLSHTQRTRGGRLYESVHMYGNMDGGYVCNGQEK